MDTQGGLPGTGTGATPPARATRLPKNLQTHKGEVKPNWAEMSLHHVTGGWMLTCLVCTAHPVLPACG